MKYLIAIFIIIPASQLNAVDVTDSDFATELVSGRGPFGPSPYDDPLSVLGRLATHVIGTASSEYTCSLVYGAFNKTPGGEKVIVTLGADSCIIAGFDHRLGDDENNPYGIDFIVFGNSAFTHSGSSYIDPDTDMSELKLSDNTYIYDEWVTVSVAQDPNGPWYTFSDGPFADSLFPSNPFQWDHDNSRWGRPLNPLRPVDPNLTVSDFNGLTVSQAINLYDGSAGGTGYDLKWLAQEDYAALTADPETGVKWIKYIKVTSGETGEIDAFSDVSCCGDYRHPFPDGDITGDCRVDIADFAVLAGSWLDCTWECK